MRKLSDHHHLGNKNTFYVLNLFSFLSVLVCLNVDHSLRNTMLCSNYNESRVICVNVTKTQKRPRPRRSGASSPPTVSGISSFLFLWRLLPKHCCNCILFACDQAKARAEELIKGCIYERTSASLFVSFVDIHTHAIMQKEKRKRQR